MRKILCSENLPKDPSNQITQLDSTNSILSEKDQNLNTVAFTTPPSIVARLMGLESMVETHFASKQGSLSRSKSMNSMDYFQSLHKKRVDSTLSFREPPSFKVIENENFFVLSFENEGENGRRKQMVCSEMMKKVEIESVFDEKRKMSKRVVSDSDISCENDGNRCNNKFQDVTNTLHQFNDSSEKKCFDSEGVELLKPKYCNEVLIGEKLKKRRRRRKKRTKCYIYNKIETEFKSDDSSPVSVLEFERKSCVAVGLSSRRKLTPELENDKLILDRSDDNLMINEKKGNAIENNKYEDSKEKKHMKEYKDIWGETWRLVQDEFGGSNQVHAWMNEQSDLGSICAEFESEIFDQLLNEVVICQLVG